MSETFQDVPRRKHDGDPLIVNLGALRNSPGIKHDERAEPVKVNADYLQKVWADRAVFHDPDKHVVTRADGSHIAGRSKAEVVSCRICASHAAWETPYFPAEMIEKVGALREGMRRDGGEICSECWTGPIVHIGFSLTAEQEQENEAALEAWEATLLPQQIQRRRERVGSIRASRRVAIRRRKPKEKK